MTPVVGRGQLRLDTPTAGADITAAWQPLAAFDAEPITSMGVDLVPATGAFTFQWRGLWRADMYFSMTHDESTGSREIGVRRYNVTTGTPDIQTIIGIGRNQDTTVFSFSDLLEVNEYDTWRYEIGGIDTVSMSCGTTSQSDSSRQEFDMRDFFTLVGVIGAILVLAITLTVISNGQPAEQPQEAKVIFCKDINDKYIVAFRMGTALHLIYEGSISSVYLSRADGTIGIVSAGREIRTNLKPKDFLMLD